MENLPESLDVTTNEWRLLSTGENPNFSRETNNTNISVEQLIFDLQDEQSREAALFFLSMRKSEDLGPLLWHSDGTITILLMEIMSTYCHLGFSDPLASISNRACDAIGLLQWVASHSSTKKLFLEAWIPCFLYPLLSTKSKEKHYDDLRLTSLGVIAALIKVDDPEVIHFLLESQIFPHCLRCMEFGSIDSKTVATYIVSKILKQQIGIEYCCNYVDRFYAVSYMLRTMVEEMAENISLLLLTHLLVCYLKLSENPRCCVTLRSYIPLSSLTKMCGSGTSLARDEPTVLESLKQIIYNITAGRQQPRTLWMDA